MREMKESIISSVRDITQDMKGEIINSQREMKESSINYVRDVTQTMKEEIINSQIKIKESNISNVRDITQTIKGDIINCQKENSSKSWGKVGTLGEVEEIMKKYPTTEYTYGMNHNNSNIEEVAIHTWNKGIRVFFKYFYPQGDDGGKLTIGNSIFTKGTDDNESQQGYFYQRYVDEKFHYNYMGSNGNINSNNFYVKKH